MAVVYGSGTKNRRMIVVRDDIDAGSGAGKLKLFSATDVLLAEITLDDPASAVVADVLSLLGTPLEDVGLVDGVADYVEISDSDDNAVADMTVGEFGSGKDVIIGSVNVSTGQTVRVNSGSITHG